MYTYVYICIYDYVCIYSHCQKCLLFYRCQVYVPALTSNTCSSTTQDVTASGLFESSLCLNPALKCASSFFCCLKIQTQPLPLQHDHPVSFQVFFLPLTHSLPRTHCSLPALPCVPKPLPSSPAIMGHHSRRFVSSSRLMDVS